MTFFISGLTLLFIYFKMTDYINWSWVWVVSPLWIWFLIAFVIANVIIILDVILGQKDIKEK